MGHSLGYQVEGKEECYESLRQWLERNKIFSVWGETVVGSGCDYGVNPELNPAPGETNKVYDFEEDEQAGTCSFTTKNEYFLFTICQLPTDKWGNTATFSTDIQLVEGCFSVEYKDDGYVGFEFPAEWELEDENDFLVWVEEHRSELVSQVWETLVCNSTANAWRYITTNKPFHSPEWTQALDEFLASVDS